MNTTVLSGINLYKGTYAEFLEELKQKIEGKRTVLIVTPNPEMLYEASRDNELMQILQKADYALPDGAGIFVAYQIQHSALPKVFKVFLLPYWCIRGILHTSSLKKTYGERITGSRLTRDLFGYVQESGTPITVIDPPVRGNTPGDRAKKTSQLTMKVSLLKDYPLAKINIIIDDTVPGDFPEYGIIFCTHGNGRQEKLLDRILKEYPFSGVGIGVGGSIDLMTGFRSEAPWVFRRFGGEWLYRLIKNPKRHYKRMKKVMFFIFSTF